MANFALCQIPNTVGCYVPNYLPTYHSTNIYPLREFDCGLQSNNIPTYFLTSSYISQKYSSKGLLKNIDIENTKCLTAKKFSFSIGIVSLSTEFVLENRYSHI